MPAPGHLTEEFVVRPYAAGDRERLLELLRHVWPQRRPIDAHVDRRWWWQYSEPPILVVEDPRTTALAGVCAYMPFSLRTHSVFRKAAWFVDFYVRPEHQGRGFGRRLTQAVQERFEVTASLSQTAMAWRVFEKLSWRPRVPRQLAMHPWPKPWMFRPRAGYELSRHAVDANLPVHQELDALWQRLAPAYPALAERSAAAITRRYASHGGRAYELICAKRDGAVVGYMVLRAPGLIVDVLAGPDDATAFGAMLSEAGRRLIELGTSRLHCLVTPGPWRRVLARHGFLSAETPLLGARLQGQKKWLTFAASSPAVPDPAEWFVTLGDCDLDIGWTGA